MASSHGSLVRWDRPTEYYRLVDPALLRLRKAPERVCTIHRATMTRPTRQGQPSPAAKGATSSWGLARGAAATKSESAQFTG
jgi:hypothetical protein